MTLKPYSLADKINAIDMEIKEIQKEARANPESALNRHLQILKSVCADLRSREALPKNNALGALEREIERLVSTKGPAGFQHGRLLELANIVVSKWPIISQALEQYGELSAE